MPAVLVADLSSLPHADFWLTMENRWRTDPYHVKGRRWHVAEMSRHVWKWTDDEYRSLAASFRDAGGYEKTAVPLEEFQWAGPPRSCLPSPATDGFEPLVRQAVKPVKKRLAGAAARRWKGAHSGKADLVYVDEAMSQSSKLLAQPADEACINFPEVLPLDQASGTGIAV
jgi:hypothetical protein